MSHRIEYRNESGAQTRALTGPGPWQQEPDKVQWIDDATDLDCLIVRNHFGGLCGYVGVPPGHHAYGSSGEGLSAHGDVNYADVCQPEATPSDGVCHVPVEGRPDGLWWLGFDCGHAWDLMPRMQAEMERTGRPEVDDIFGQTYKTIEYVTAEVEQLARQLA